MQKAMAEFIGILLGDGSIGIYKSKIKNKIKTLYRIKITLNSKDDLDYSEYVRNLIKKLFKLETIVKKRKDENALDIFIFKKEIIILLLNLGMELAPKWNRAKVPRYFLAKNLISDVLRGYVDTDGCIKLAQNNGTLYPRIEMKISPAPMQKQLIDGLFELGFEPKIYQIGKGKVSVSLHGKRNLKMWGEKIGFSNRKNILRYNKFN
ncbi:MAG: LAGLIDADG family homing endonuclease [Candidatus Micrarchaeota archaeon]